MRSALRRLALLLAGTALGGGAVGAVAALVSGASLERSLSVTYYIVGAFLIVLGFFAGNRGPLRGKVPAEEEPITGLFGVGLALRGARRASRREQRDTLETAVIFLGLGAWLILLGIAADASVPLF